MTSPQVVRNWGNKGKKKGASSQNGDAAEHLASSQNGDVAEHLLQSGCRVVVLTVYLDNRRFGWNLSAMHSTHEITMRNALWITMRNALWLTSKRIGTFVIPETVVYNVNPNYLNCVYPSISIYCEWSGVWSGVGNVTHRRWGAILR